MLTLSDEQLAQLEALDAKGFVVQICDELLTEVPELAHKPGRSTALAQMDRALEQARLLGFTSSPHTAQFMRLAVLAPRFYEQRPVDEWLSKPVGSVEQRFDDLYAVLIKQLDRKDARNAQRENR